MEVLLKSFGFDADVVKEQFETARQQVDSTVQSFRGQLDRIELQCSRIEAQQEDIVRRLEASEQRQRGGKAA